MDCQYENYNYILSEIDHYYGTKIHILKNPYLMTLLTELSDVRTKQPKINDLVREIYSGMLVEVLNKEVEQEYDPVITRMQKPVLNKRFSKSDDFVIACMARAGVIPSQVVFDKLCRVFNPNNVREDYISLNRTTGEDNEITGCQIHGSKIGGSISNKILIIPDPMGATGSSMCETINLYKQFGTPKKVILINLIITPEFVEKITNTFEHVIIYSLRLDRGLSNSDIFFNRPGLYKGEYGLNNNGYIVPGAGGLGEIMTNSFV